MNYGKYGNKHQGKRSTSRKVMSSPVTLVLSLIVFIVLAKAALGIHDKAAISDTKLDQSRVELANLESREADLTSQVGRLSTDQGIESEIRTKFKGVRNGESLAVIIGNNETASVTPASIASTTKSVGWFGRLLQKIGL